MCESFADAYLRTREDEHIYEHPALNKFCYALYEVEFELEVDEKTGEYTILKVTDGKSVLTPE